MQAAKRGAQRGQPGKRSAVRAQHAAVGGGVDAEAESIPGEHADLEQTGQHFLDPPTRLFAPAILRRVLRPAASAPTKSTAGADPGLVGAGMISADQS
ncbi:MAG TPA: hypothetical protein VHV82_12650 [Sporichthyaceae bacterium]|nr:hypothetical protein [Sporichthyaceae bacterium]